ncbi:class I SAM-dependent methyltransferase [Oleomonas cavernae]|nr:methyltransferase domain-containing protein [Oleomonas cavernae]
MNALPPANDLPLEFDAACYRSTYPDLSVMSDELLLSHYRQWGRAEGRRTNSLRCRGDFTALIRPHLSALEIGPFNAPILSGPQVRYFDVLTKPELVARAGEHGLDPSTIPDIHHVSPTGDLDSIGETFDVVVSSHNIEHSPDFIHHLACVERRLKPGGRYFVIVPDKRYCFDYYIAESTIADVLDAHASARRVHTLRAVIEHVALTTHNGCVRHWAGDHGPAPALATERVAHALELYRNSAGRYLDVHAWYFTPASMRAIMAMLVALGHCRLRPLRLYDTLRDHNEFWMVLEKPA